MNFSSSLFPTMSNIDYSKFFTPAVNNAGQSLLNPNSYILSLPKVAEPNSWLKFFTDGSNMDNIIKPIATAGGLWGAYNQQRMAKEQHKLTKDAYNYGKALTEEERRRRATAEANFNSGFGGN